MSGLNYYSDYGSGSSSNSSSSWATQESWPSQTNLQHSDRTKERNSSSYQDLVMGRCTLEDIMKEFKMNGSDSPYTPAEDRKNSENIWGNQTSNLTGLGPTSAYLRQKSWPAPERSPAQRLPPADWFSSVEFTPQEFTSSSTPIEEITATPAPVNQSTLTEEQLRVIKTLPNTVLFSLLQELENTRDGSKKFRRLPSECRFCKNNGERECYYRSHSLKDGSGRVTCPVLRAFVCARCGASGDTAHTIKYCPLSTADERLTSTAIMRSIRTVSGRRRNTLPPSVSPADNYVVFGETTPSVISDNNTYNSYAVTPLDPLWAALEQKLML